MGEFKPKQTGFGEIIGIYEKRSVTVPPFQRGYSWKSAHVSTLWDDVLAFQARSISDKKAGEYFLGPIVIREEKDKIVLLDGQQRLATITILFSILRDSAYATGTPKGTELGRDIQRELIEKKAGGFSLHLNEADLNYFRDTIQRFPAVPQKARPRSHQLILNAREILLAQIQTQLAGKSADEQVAWIGNIKGVVESFVKMVAITVDSEDDAYMIFETLNDRGLRLSTPDLLLNFLMGKAENEAERKEIRSKWNGMLDKLGAKNMDYFFRHMWLSKYGDVKAHGLFREIRTHLDTTKESSLTFINTCDEECDAYVGILERDPILMGAANVHISALVKDLRTTASFPLLLSGLQCLGPVQFAELARTICELVVRYSYFANQNPGKLENELYSLARTMREMKKKGDSNERCVQHVKDSLKKLNPEDAQVQTGTKKLHLTRDEARYIIPSIANHLQSETKELKIDAANLEHIFPINPEKKDWPNHEDLEPYTWHLGNLTSLGTKLNRKASNRSFKDKTKDHYTPSELVMVKTIASTYTDWTVDTIINRAESLGPAIVKIWPGPK